MFIDAHTHLNLTDLFEKWKEHIKQFQQAGGKILVNAGAHTDYNRNGILIAQEAKSLFPEVVVKTTIGFHPEDAQNIKESDFPSLIEGLEQQYRQHKEHIIAIGECGIDLHRNQDLEHQQTFFRLQAILARKLWLPLVIHSRDGLDETLAVIKDFTDLHLYFHCRGYWPEELRKVEEMFPRVRFGYTNIVSYPNAEKTRESLRAAKKEHLLMETDAPFLPPQAFRGKTNYPKYISFVYQTCAEVLGIKQEILEKQVEENFTAMFWKIY